MNKALSMGLPRKQIINMGVSPPMEVFEKIVSLTDKESIVIGIGNIVLYGEELVMHFTNKGKEVAY
jgi:hypothetical protein